MGPLSGKTWHFGIAGKRGAKGGDDDDYEAEEEEEEAWEPGRKRKAALKSKARYRDVSGRHLQ